MTKLREMQAPRKHSAAGGGTLFVCTFDAAEVYLAGDFNDWNPRSDRMVKRDGAFQKKMKLQSGSYEYKFVVDGEWRIDPAASEQRPNQFGSMNSVIHV